MCRRQRLPPGWPPSRTSPLWPVPVRTISVGWPGSPSVGNFVLPHFPDDPRHNADAAFAFLQSRGILTRQMGGYGLPQHLRITVGTGEEMEIVAAALAEFMAGT